MDFNNAVKTCLIKKYADFSGTATRSEFWWFWLFSVLVTSVGNILSLGLNTEIFSNLTMILLLLPTFAVASRRLHDVGWSGWWQLISLTIIGWFWLVYMYMKESKIINNKYK